MPAIKKFPIEGVSWLEQVFEMVSARGADQQALTLYIPDTVVFRYQRPAALFTNDAAEEHQVSCRDELSDLSADAIYQRFAGKSEAADKVAAIYVYNDRAGHDSEDRDEAAQDTQNMVVEYMNAPQLRHFLQHRPKENNGILQRFLPSKGAFHTTIRVMWTPRSCHIETRTNRHKMHDPKLSVTDRYSTFDGGPHLSISHSLKDGLFYKNIKGAADNIVKHLETLIPRPYQVWEAVMYFKYSAPDRGTQREKSGISFLWCSSLRVFKDELLDLRRLDEFWTSDLKTEVIVNKEAPDKELKAMRCPVTGKTYADGTGTEVKVSTIVKYMSILGDSHPNSFETLKLKQDAMGLDEHASSKDAIGGRGNAKNAGGDGAIRETIAEMMEKKTAARDVCDLIKRVLFGNPDAADAAKLRAIFNHEMFPQQIISVSEDTALDSALAVERHSIHTKSRSTPSNDAAQILAKRGRFIKKNGAAGLMPASVVEVKSIVVGAEIGGGNIQRMRASSSKSPLGCGDGLSGILSYADSSKGGASRAKSSEITPFSVHQKHVDLELGKSRILSFRRLKYMPMGASAMNDPERSQHQVHKTLKSGEKATGEEGQECKDGNQDRASYSQGTGSGDNSLYSKLKQARAPEDQASADGTLDSSTLNESIGLANTRSKVLQQYAAFDNRGAEVTSNSMRNGHASAHQERNTSAHSTRNRPPPIRLEYETISVPLPSATQMNLPTSSAPGHQKTVLPSSRALRPASAQFNAAPYHRGHGAQDKARSIKVLDAQWSDRMHSSRQEAGTGPSRISSAHRRERAAASSTASTRVSSAVSTRGGQKLPRSLSGRQDWSDGDLIDDDDDDDWDDGLEMDLPSTHVRLKRDQEMRASRDAERMLRRSGEGLTKHASGKTLPLCLQWGLDEKVRAKVLQQYSAYG